MNSEGELNFEEAFVTIDNENQQYLVRIPLKGKNFELLSGVTIVYDNDYTYESKVETIVYKNNNGQGILITWINDKLAQEESVEIADYEGTSTDELQLAKSNFKCMTNCLSDQGLPTWALGLISVACAAACVGTAGLGCVACIQGLGYYGIFVYCGNSCGLTGK
ncbi:MAG: hypothetical protein ACQEWU_21240 [Bacillota bacterium]|uniref:Uncharacterized protein n=2 Tax=Virgibacillus salarius TaxID=447199 RepID=A0A941IDT6_9BACI|nr:MULTISPECIES: hypothetical protein [Virgibacillus]MBR7797445.1 hypothetical protein [Virgibacillus salarius]MCC2252703.1 hypothetical protein [Virgibacillus sp. AGTR]NAZ10157.1 hypothetical protein [Agaribacter marinus]